MDRNEASALADLQMHWDEAYVIDFDGDVWSARFRDCADVLCARTSSDLRELIRADYVHRQRPRSPGQPGERAGQDGEGAATGADAATAATTTHAPGTSAAEVSAAEVSAAEVSAGGAELSAKDFASIRGERMST